MSPLHRKILGFLLAPLGTALAAAIWFAVGLLFVPKLIPVMSAEDPFGFVWVLGVLTLVAAGLLLLVGVPAAIVFARRGITGLGPHVLVGCLAGLVPAAALAFAGASLAGPHLARIVSQYSSTGLGLGGATALVYWQIARPDVA